MSAALIQEGREDKITRVYRTCEISKILVYADRITDIQNISSKYDLSTAYERLRQFLNKGQASDSTISGVFLVKLPTFRGTSLSLAIEVNPIMRISVCDFYVLKLRLPLL